MAPFSGTEYDLATGKVLVAAEGKRVEKQKHALNPLYESLKAMLQRLVSLIESMGGRSNDELKSTTQEIKAIIERHEI